MTIHRGIATVACLFLFMMCSATAVTAQDACEGVVAAAKKDYQKGFFDEASFRIQTCIERGALKGEQLKEGYLLLGQIYYANLEIEKARQQLRILLEQDPLLELSNEEYKRGFIELMGKVKSEMVEVEPEAEIEPEKEETKAALIRSGFWGSLGLAAGNADIKCNCPPLISNAIPDDDPWRGGSAGTFSLAMGGTLSPHIQLGGELSTWARSVEGTASTRKALISLLTVSVKYFPSATGGFYLKGGVGLGNSNVENRSVKLEGAGLAVQLGLGYEIPIGRSKKYALAPYLNLNAVLANEDTVFLENTRVEAPVEPGFAQLGVAIVML